MNLHEIIFVNARVFWLLAAVPVLVVLFFIAERRRRLLLGRLLAPRLQPRLAGSVSIAKRRTVFALKILALVLGVAALARPQLGFVWEESKGKGRDILIAIDTSRSMLADDLRPSRLARAKLAAQDLLSQLEGDRAGVIAFAGEAFLSAPLTPDFNAVRETLNDLDTEVIPRGGTNLTAAIAEAAEAFGKGESQHQALIIFTDGEELEADAAAAAREHRQKFSIFTVGLGSPLGSKIPVPQQFGGTEFVRDDAGELVISKLDEPRLVEVAEAGGGFYVHLENGPSEMRQIVREGLGKMNSQENEARVTKQPIERYQWPLAGALACFVISLLIGERRRLLVVPRAAALAMLLAMMLWPGAVSAETAKAIDPTGGGIPHAAYNNGRIAFQAGDFDTAARAFSRALGEGDTALQERAAYNLANTLARRGAVQKEKKDKITEWKNALQHYDEALRLNSKNADAAFNRGLVEKAIADLENEPPKQDQQDKKDDQKKEDEKKDDQKKDDKNPQDKNRGEDQKKEQSQNDQKSGDQKEQQENGGKKEDQEKKDQGKQEQGKQENGKPQQGEQTEPKDVKPQAGDKPPDEPKTGEIQPANPGEANENKDKQAAEAAEAAAAALEGRMTEKDAKQLLDSLRRYDVRGRLVDPKEMRKLRPRDFKNW